MSLGLNGFVVGRWLRYVIGIVEKEDRDLFVRLFTDIDSTVNAIRRLVPAGLSRGDFELLVFATVAVRGEDAIGFWCLEVRDLRA